MEIPNNPQAALQKLKEIAAAQQANAQKKQEPEKACPLIGVVGGSFHTCIREKCKFWDVELEPMECRLVNACDVLFDVASMISGVAEMAQGFDLGKMIDGVHGKKDEEQEDGIEETI